MTSNRIGSFCVDVLSLTQGLASIAKSLGIREWQPNQPAQQSLLAWIKNHPSFGTLRTSEDVVLASRDYLELNDHLAWFAGDTKAPFKPFSNAGFGMVSIWLPSVHFANTSRTLLTVPRMGALSAVQFAPGQDGVEMYHSQRTPGRPIVHIPSRDGVKLVLQAAPAPQSAMELCMAGGQLLHDLAYAERQRISAPVIMPTLDIPKATTSLDWLTGLQGVSRDKSWTLEQVFQAAQLQLNETGIGVKSAAPRELAAVSDAAYTFTEPFIGCFTFPFHGHGEVPIGSFYAGYDSWKKPQS